MADYTDEQQFPLHNWTDPNQWQSMAQPQQPQYYQQQQAPD